MQYSVLVVDDCEEVSGPLKYLMDAEGFETAVARDGSEALKILADHRVSLILLDLNMPGMGGIEFLKHKSEIGNNVPVVLMSAELGYGDFNVERRLTKPFRFQDVIGVVRELLAKSA